MIFWRISEFKRPGKKVKDVLEKPGGNISQNMSKSPIGLKLNATLRPFFPGLLNSEILQKSLKLEKLRLKSVKNFTFCRFLGMYWQNFSCRSIWYPLQVSMISCCHSVRCKSCATFLPGYSIFSLIGKLPIATQTPWNWFLRVPWWNTFQLGSRKAPKPLLAKKKFLSPQIIKRPKSQSQ